MFLSVNAMALSTRLPPDSSTEYCSPDKPLLHWIMCQPSEEGCLPGRVEGVSWKKTCHACDSAVSIPQYGSNQSCSQQCPNRYVNQAKACVLDTSWNHFLDFYDNLPLQYGGLLLFFVFPFAFLFSKILPKNKVWSTLIWIAFLMVNIPLRCIPLIMCVALTVPFSCGYFMILCYRQIKELLGIRDIKKFHPTHFIALLGGCFALCLWGMKPFVSGLFLLIFIPLYTAILLNSHQKKENK